MNDNPAVERLNMPGLLLVLWLGVSVTALGAFKPAILLSVLAVIAGASVILLCGLFVVTATRGIVRRARQERRWRELLYLPCIWIIFGHIPVGIAIFGWQCLPLLQQQW